MTQSEVINKLSRECCLALGDFYYFDIVKRYIQMALSIGMEHYSKEMEEIVVLSKDGVELGRFKSVTETAEKLGLNYQNISAVLNGRQQTCGGMVFIKQNIMI
jgi:ribosomal 30S subunit maturation factor RimM